MNKITIKIDIDKIDKSKIKTRSFVNKAGATLNVREYELEIVPVTEKVVFSKDDFEIVKVGFVSEKSTKREDGTWDNGVILGEAKEFRKKGTTQTVTQDVETGGVNIDDIDFGEVDNTDEIPF